MIDIKLIRENPEKFKTACKAKKIPADIELLLNIDSQLSDSRKKLQDIVTTKNQIGKSIPKMAGNEKQAALSQLSELKKQEAGLEEKNKNLTPQFDQIMQQVAQPADDDVPFGEDDTQNVEIKKVGQVRKFDFEPKDHVQLGLALDIMDIERGVRLAGARNYFLKGDGALLHWAVLRFAIDFMTAKGYVPMSVPLLMKDEAMRGTGYFPGSEEQTYRTEGDQEVTIKDEAMTGQTKYQPGEINTPVQMTKSSSGPEKQTHREKQTYRTGKNLLINLAGTAEVPVTAYYMGEILNANELPKKFVALSTCFRREAGAAGKDTYGLYRIHQFDKVEQVIVCENSVQESNKFHEEILANSEGIMQALELPYRVVVVCTGDLGRGQAKKYDIEAWMPSRKNYCETHSASKFYDFQARRLNLRYKDQKTKKNQFCHTLNNTVIASPRVLIPLMELYQNSDGSITIPKVLRPYMGARERIARNS